jgi:hypothetical protein
MDDPDAGDMMYAKTCVIDPPKWDESLFTGIVPDPKHMVSVPNVFLIDIVLIDRLPFNFGFLRDLENGHWNSETILEPL